LAKGKREKQPESMNEGFLLIFDVAGLVF